MSREKEELGERVEMGLWSLIPRSCGKAAYLG